MGVAKRWLERVVVSGVVRAGPGGFNVVQAGTVNVFPVLVVASSGGGPPTCTSGVGEFLIGPCRHDVMVDGISAEDV